MSTRDGSRDLDGAAASAGRRVRIRGRAGSRPCGARLPGLGAGSGGRPTSLGGGGGTVTRGPTAGGGPRVTYHRASTMGSSSTVGRRRHPHRARPERLQDHRGDSRVGRQLGVADLHSRGTPTGWARCSAPASRAESGGVTVVSSVVHSDSQRGRAGTAVASSRVSSLLPRTSCWHAAGHAPGTNASAAEASSVPWNGAPRVITRGPVRAAVLPGPQQGGDPAASTRSRPLRVRHLAAPG